MKLTIIAIILCVSLGAKAQQDSTEMKKAIDAMQKMYSVHFVYDSSLANIKPKGIFQRSSSLPENLKGFSAEPASDGRFRENMSCCSARTTILFPATYARIREKR